MKTYELTVVLAPGMASEKLSAAISAIEKSVKSVKGKVSSSEDWGEKQFAYTIKKFDRGIYRHFVMELPAQGVSELELKLKHLPGVIRLLLVRA